MGNKRFKNLFINTILFGIGQFGTTFLGILLVPIYTNCMTKAEYGTADLLINMAAMLLPIVTVCIADGVIKFAFDGRHNVNEVFSVSFFVCFIGIIFSILLYPIIYKYGQITEYILFFYLMLFTNILNNLFLAITKALNQIKTFTIISLIKTLVMLGSNIITLKVFDIGVKGYLFSYIISNIVAVIGCIIADKLYSRIRIRNLKKSVLKEMTLFSLPLIPNNISGWAMNSIDRYMLTYMLDASYNGLYSVAHKIPSIVTMFSSVFNQAWNFSALEEQKSKDSKEYYRSVFKIYSSYMFILSSMVLLVIKPVMLIWVGEEFKEAWMYAPYLLIAVIFSCLTGFYVPLFVTAEKTNMLFVSTLAGAITNIVLNAVLIPVWQINGASLATVITHFVVWFIRGAVIEKYTKVGLNRKKAYCNAGLLMIQGTLLIFSGTYWYISQVIMVGIVLLVNLKEINVLLKKFKPLLKQLKKH